MIGKKVNVFFIALFLLYSGFLAADIDIFGYFENRFFLLNHLDMSWDNLNEKFNLGDYNRMRLKFKASPSEKVTINAAVDFFSFHGFITGALGTYEDSGGTESGDNNVQIDVDRAYVDLHFKKFDISLGKQRIAMGVSYLWAPLDIFNRVNIFEPKEEKPGANALKLYIPLGTYSSITGVFSPENDFSSSKAGFRTQTNVFGIDMALTVIHYGGKETSIYGVDFRGENLIGWWIEGGLFVSAGQKDKKIVLGFDYTFPIQRGLYWLNEFYYDSGGEKNSSNYDFDLLYSGERFTLGRKYFFSMLRYGFTDFLSASVNYIANWGDGSYILYPMIQYEISQNIMISSGFYFPLGDKNGELNRSDQNIFFLWLKVNF